MAGYIGAKASVVTSGAERKQTYAITTTTTSLTGLAYTPTKVHVFHNGIRLVDGTDYTATNGTSITLTTAAEDGDEVVVISYATFQTSDTVSAANGGTFAGNLNTVDIRPTTDDNNDLGTSSKRFQDAYLSGGVYLGGTGSANYLDDYEEGDWTPVINAETTSPSVSYTDRTGKYTKVGNMVTLYADIQPSITGGSGDATITGLPFTVTSVDVRPIGPFEGRSVNLSSGYTFFYLMSYQDQDKLYFRQNGDNVTEVGIAIGNLGSRVGFTFTYMTDS